MQPRRNGLIAGMIAYLAGLLFALGLGISGMTRPDKVIGFLDVLGTRGAWDPTLAFVMMGAVGVYAVLYRVALSCGAPLLGGALEIPRRRTIDIRLVIGAMLFGVGWGLSGICPGPGLTSLVSGSAAVLVFVTAMVAGMYGHRGLEAVAGEQADQAHGSGTSSCHGPGRVGWRRASSRAARN